MAAPLSESLGKVKKSIQSKAGSEFGDKGLIEKGRIWGDLGKRRAVTRLENFVKAQDKLSEALRKAADAGNLDKYRKIEDALLKLKGGRTSKQLGLNVQVNKGEIWRKYGNQGVKDDLKAKDSLRSFLSSRGKERGKVPELSKLSTPEEFKEKLSKTDALYDGRVKNSRNWLSNIRMAMTAAADDKFSKSVQGKFFQGLLKSLENGMGGNENLRSALSSAFLFTGNEYSKIRGVKRKARVYNSWPVPYDVGVGKVPLPALSPSQPMWYNRGVATRHFSKNQTLQGRWQIGLCTRLLTGRERFNSSTTHCPTSVPSL